MGAHDKGIPAARPLTPAGEELLEAQEAQFNYARALRHKPFALQVVYMDGGFSAPVFIPQDFVRFFEDTTDTRRETP
jgi:hypothetical protein